MADACRLRAAIRCVFHFLCSSSFSYVICTSFEPSVTEVSSSLSSLIPLQRCQRLPRLVVPISLTCRGLDCLPTNNCISISSPSPSLPPPSSPNHRGATSPVPTLPRTRTMVYDPFLNCTHASLVSFGSCRTCIPFLFCFLAFVPVDYIGRLLHALLSMSSRSVQFLSICARFSLFSARVSLLTVSTTTETRHWLTLVCKPSAAFWKTTVSACCLLLLFRHLT